MPKICPRYGQDIPKYAQDMPKICLEAEVKFVDAVTAECRRKCKIFASGVNFSGNNVIYNINESTKYILS